MAYFDKVSDIIYLKYKKNKYDGKYIRIKNIFSRIKIIDDVLPGATTFEDYFIQDGERPDTVAYDYYGDSGLDWIILIINNIKNVYEDWPMTTTVLNEYVAKKYANAGDVHHYETLQQTYNGTIILESGITVGESFRFTNPEGNTLSATLSRRAVSNYEYEADKNEEKRQLYILKPSFVDAFTEIFEKEMKFTPSTEFVTEKLKISNN